MPEKKLDLRKVFGMVVTYDDKQPLVSPDKPFDVITELHPGGESAIHVHPHQDETYEVQEGEIEVYLNNSWQTLKPGQRVVIPKGTVHAFRNKGAQKVIAFNRHHPGLRFGEMLETIQQYINSGKLKGTKGFKNLAYMSAIMVQYSDVMKPVKPPVAVIQFMATLGKVFGYK